MAADSSIDETEAPVAAAEDEPAGLGDKLNGPPRPPRPARRASISLRIPLPSAVTPGSKLSSSRAEPAARFSVAPSAEPAAPAAGADPAAAAEVEEGAPEPARTMPSPGMPPRRTRAPTPPQLDLQNIATPLPPEPPSSAPVTPVSPGNPSGGAGAAPPLSFDSEDVDPSDRAPVAPLTPWNDVPRLRESPELSSPPVDVALADDDHEETIVGQVPQDLLALSSEENGQENTRAYEAPQELIELARRKREERRQAKAARARDAGAHVADAPPPTARAPQALECDQGDLATVTVPLDDFASGEAAPPVARSSAVRGVPVEERRGSNPPPSLEELAAAISRPGERESIPVSVGEVPSADRRPDSLPDFARGSRGWARGGTWLVLVGLLILIGVVLARWGGVPLLSR